jgi:hypothetical protein
MSKKRTRKEKERAIHNLTVSWGPRSSRLNTEIASTSVNSQLLKSGVEKSAATASSKLVTFTEKNVGLASIKKDLMRSLILVAFILASEIMIYLNWTRILSIASSK